MNNKQNSTFLEWSTLDTVEEYGSTTSTAQSERVDNSTLDDAIRFIRKADDKTIDFESNMENGQAISSLSLQSSKLLEPCGIKDSFKSFSDQKRKIKENTFYRSIKQYDGTVQLIDEEADTFTAHLVNIDEGDDELVVEFSFKDCSLGSDRELVRVGANFVWLIGQEDERGTATNIAKFVFRRTPVIHGRALQGAKDNAKEWAEFFSGIGIADTAER